MIEASIIGIDRLEKYMAQIHPQVKAGAARAISSLVIDLTRKVKEEKLTGQVLHTPTGRLRRSINHVIRVEGDSIVGIVGTNVEYAARHEYGFHGIETVKEHLRMVKQAFGRPLKNPRQIKINSFVRKPDTPENSFLRSALKEMEGKIKATLERELVAMVK